MHGKAACTKLPYGKDPQKIQGFLLPHEDFVQSLSCPTIGSVTASMNFPKRRMDPDAKGFMSATSALGFRACTKGK
jgi:hypothetical protein